jgi:hypothetical protein
LESKLWSLPIQCSCDWHFLAKKKKKERNVLNIIKKLFFGHPIRCDLGQGRVEFEDVFEVELEWRSLGFLVGV